MINLKSNNSNIKVVLNEENNFLQDYLKFQQKLNTDMYILLKESVNTTIIVNASYSKEFTDKLDNFVNFFKKSTSNITNLENLLATLNVIKASADDLEDQLEKYNKLYNDLFNDLVRNSVAIETFLNSFQESNKNELYTPTENNFYENTLLISEVDDKVVLPYTIDELNQQLEEYPNRYKNLEDIINTVYTIPLKHYSNSSLMRFKEAYRLIRKRESGTVFQALDLAFELFSNYNLHPAIITACKDLNELDVYLSCLEYNELDDFHFFKTLFKYRPVKIKTS